MCLTQFLFCSPQKSCFIFYLMLQNCHTAPKVLKKKVRARKIMHPACLTSYNQKFSQLGMIFSFSLFLISPQMLDYDILCSVEVGNIHESITLYGSLGGFVVQKRNLLNLEDRGEVKGYALQKQLPNNIFVSSPCMITIGYSAYVATLIFL